MRAPADCRSLAEHGKEHLIRRVVLLLPLRSLSLRRTASRASAPVAVDAVVEGPRARLLAAQVRSPEEAPANAASTARFYLPELDALRFFAFLLVFCDHAPIYHGWFVAVREMGAFGLCIFFSLSAYLIATLLLRERELTGTVRLRAFAARRALRIWPLYFAVIGIAFLIGTIWTRAQADGRYVALLSLLLGNLFVLQHNWAGMGLIAPLWSISLEEQFYLCIPMLARFGGRRAIAAFSAITLVVAYGVLVWLGQRGAYPISTVWANSFVQFQFFAAGALVALSTYSRTIRLSLALRGLILVAVLLCFLVAAQHYGLHGWAMVPTSYLVIGYLLALVATVGILIATLNLPLRVPRPLLYLGRISFGLYLFHDLFIELIFNDKEGLPRLADFAESHRLAGLMAVFACTVAAAALSCRFFERPFLRLKGRLEILKTRPI